MKASWKRGYHSKIKADIAATELIKIEEENGGVLTAGIVLHKAKSKTHKLHSAFEWDNEIAADKHRMLQARNLIGSIEVVYEEDPQARPVKKYHIVTEEKKQGSQERKVYKDTKTILTNVVTRDELLGRAITDALSFRRKYSQLSELVGFFRELDEFVINAKVA